jgi:hypothetical protein
MDHITKEEDALTQRPYNSFHDSIEPLS